MKLSFSILFTLLSVTTQLQAQVDKGPEKTVRKFTAAVNKGDLEKAMTFVILETQEDMQRDPYRPFRGFKVTTITCETYETENGMDCACVSQVDGKRAVIIYEMTEVDNKWKIYDMSIKRMTNEYEETIPTGSKKTGSPQDLLLEFAAYNADENYKKGQGLLIMNAAKTYEKQVAQNPGSLPVEINAIDCTARGEWVKCSCEQVTADGNHEPAYFQLALIGDKWKIIGSGTQGGVDGVVRRFVMALADGECQEAMEISSGDAVDLVQGMIDAGCVRYTTEIMTIECEEEENYAQCKCVEIREGGMGEMTYRYYLHKENGTWTVSNYQKDFGMDENAITTVDTTYAVIDSVALAIADSIDKIIVIDTDIEPFYAGGTIALNDFIATNLVYPEKAKTAKKQGTVYVQFVVLKDGTISNPVVVKGVSSELDAEAIRLVNLMPKFVPAKVDGSRVSAYYTLPVVFKL